MKLSRRGFLFGAAAVAGAAATPLWARHLSDEMAKLQPKPRVQVPHIEFVVTTEMALPGFAGQTIGLIGALWMYLGNTIECGGGDMEALAR